MAIILIAIVLYTGCSDKPGHGLYPAVGVEFHTSDTLLQQVYDRAEILAMKNIVQYGDRKVMIEGAQYRSVWLETQPMGGYMYAKRDLDIARNNIEIFMDHQRNDGRLPGVIYNAAGVPDPNYCQFQGFYFPMPAFELYFLLEKDTGYLHSVYESLKDFDAYLWKTRDSDHDGCLETWCIYDNGEDHSTRFGEFPNAWSFDYPPGIEAVSGLSSEDLKIHCKEDDTVGVADMTVPIESMDVMSYSYSCREVLSLISHELNNGEEDYWGQQAAEVQERIKSYLWDSEKNACYDRDRNNQVMPVLLHNNLRCMYFGSFDQEMADCFIRDHLLNTQEFWTPMPLPSVAVNDPMFRNTPGNNWSGPPQGLTFQRSIRALENYGHYAELTMVGLKFLSVLSASGRFSQQFDPFTKAYSSEQDGYGPSILAALEFISRLYGIHITRDRIFWSSISSEHDHTYTQLWSDHEFKLISKEGSTDCYIDERKIFSFSGGVRVVTDLKGEVIEIAGIDPGIQTITFERNTLSSKIDVAPNIVYRFNDSMFK